MPELPEVETVCRGIAAKSKDLGVIVKTKALRKNLRVDIPANIDKLLLNEKIKNVRRRAKYILIDTEKHTLISHLGMSGSWRFSTDLAFRKHDHFYISFKNGLNLIFNDPRRFGLIDLEAVQQEHNSKWIKHLGVEPLSEDFSAELMLKKSKDKNVNIKTFIMDQKNVVGVGNIYASESLFLAGVKPHKVASRLNLDDWHRLIKAIKKVLFKAIKAGGTTLKDYKNTSGESGYFKQKLLVYDRQGKKCFVCSMLINLLTQSGRSTYWCKTCQK